MSQRSKKRIRKQSRNAKQSQASGAGVTTMSESSQNQTTTKENEQSEITTGAIVKYSIDRMSKTPQQEIFMGLPGMQNLSQKAMLDTAFFQFCKQIPGVNSENPTEGWNYVDLAPDEEKYLEPVMNFSKTKSIWLEKRNICTISRMAMELKMPELLDKCRTFMESNLCKDSCLAVLVASKQCKMKELTIKSAALLVQNFPFITESKDFKELKHTHLTFILRVVEEEIFSEDVYHALLLWVKHDKSKRQQYFGKLFTLLDLSSMDRSFLKNVVLNEHLVQNDENCFSAATQASEQEPSTIDSLD